MAKPLSAKVSAEVDRYGFDFSARMNGETVSSGTITATPSGLTITGNAVIGSILSSLIAAGAAGEYQLTGQVITSGGRTLRETATLVITA